MSLLNNSNSKLIPLVETIFNNKGGEADQWQACAKVIREKTDE